MFHFNVLVVLWKGKTVIRKALHPLNDCRHWVDRAGPYTIYQEMFEDFMLPSADKLYGDADLIFQQNSAPAHTAKCTKSWFNDHGVNCTCLASKLTRPELHRESGVLSRGRWETPDPTMQMTWRPLSKQPGRPLHLSSATGWLPPCSAALLQ